MKPTEQQMVQVRKTVDKAGDILNGDLLGPRPLRGYLFAALDWLLILFGK
jgi:hypothetical protein